MAFLELYAQTTGNNLNAGSTTDDIAPHTYVSKVVANGWNQATGVFTVASGDPAADGVAAGQLASVYVTAGATIATFIGRITSRDANSVTVSLTACSGTPPATDALGATTLKVGGALKGPNGAVGFPFNFLAAAMVSAAGDTYRLNLKNGVAYAVTAAVAHTLAGPGRFEGYTSAPGDGVKWVLDGGVSGASYVPLTVSGADCEIVNLEIQNNGATGNAAGFVGAGTGLATRIVVHDVRGAGFGGAQSQLIECDAYRCNQSATTNLGGYAPTSLAGSLIRCKSRDNSGADNHGYSLNANAVFSLIDCISDGNGGDGVFVSSNTGRIRICGGDFYDNGRDGIRLNNGAAASHYIENANIVKNVGWGINGTGAGARYGKVVNCGFGSGSQVNGSGTTTGLKSMTETGSVIYPSGKTPWFDPTTGDFRIILPEAKGTGRGSFTDTEAGYGGTIGYPDRGSAQHLGLGDVFAGAVVQ